MEWSETIGPLIDRPGRPGTWGTAPCSQTGQAALIDLPEYYNTDGFGLLEFLEWTEDMELERVLAIYAGYSLSINGSEGASYPEDAMGEVLQEALDELVRYISFRRSASLVLNRYRSIAWAILVLCMGLSVHRTVILNLLKSSEFYNA